MATMQQMVAPPSKAEIGAVIERKDRRLQEERDNKLALQDTAGQFDLARQKLAGENSLLAQELQNKGQLATGAQSNAGSLALAGVNNTSAEKRAAATDFTSRAALKADYAAKLQLAGAAPGMQLDSAVNSLGGNSFRSGGFQAKTDAGKWRIAGKSTIDANGNEVLDPMGGGASGPTHMYNDVTGKVMPFPGAGGEAGNAPAAATNPGPVMQKMGPGGAGAPQVRTMDQYAIPPTSIQQAPVQQATVQQAPALQAPIQQAPVQTSIAIPTMPSATPTAQANPWYEQSTDLGQVLGGATRGGVYAAQQSPGVVRAGLKAPGQVLDAAGGLAMDAGAAYLAAGKESRDAGIAKVRKSYQR